MVHQKFHTILLVLFTLCCLQIDAAETPVVPYTNEAGETTLSLSFLSTLALSPDGKILAGYNALGIYIWDLLPEPSLRKNYIPAAEIANTKNTGFSIFITPNNHLIVVTREIQIFDLDTLKLIQSIRIAAANEDYTVDMAAISNDGISMAIEQSLPRRLQILNLTTGKKESETFLDEEENEYYSCISFSPDNKKLLLSGRDGKACLWDASPLRFLLTFSDGSGHYFRSCFSPDGRYAVAGTADGFLAKWNTTTGERIFEVYNHPGYISNVKFTSDGKNILTSHENYYLGLLRADDPESETSFNAFEDPAIILCDAETGKETKRFSSNLRESSTLFVADNRVYGIDTNGLIACWDLQNGEILKQFGDDFFWPAGITVSPDNTQFAVIAGSSRIYLCDRKTLKKIKTIENGNKCDQIQYSPNGQWLLAVNTDGVVVVWDVKTGDIKQKIEILPKPAPSDNLEDSMSQPYWIKSVQFFPDNQTLLVLTSVNEKYKDLPGMGLNIFSLETGKIRAAYSHNWKKVITGACVSPAGEIIVYIPGCMEIWDNPFETMISSITPPLESTGELMMINILGFTDDGSIMYGLYSSNHFEIDWKTGNFVKMIPDTTGWIHVTDTWMERDIIMLCEVYRGGSIDQNSFKFINWKTGKRLATFPDVHLAKLTQDKLNLICDDNNQLKVWDMNRVLNGFSVIKDAMLY